MEQDQFEERVSKNLSQYVEKQKREHDVKQLNGELKNVIENLVKAKENLSKVETSLNDAVNRGITSDRRLKVFLEEQFLCSNCNIALVQVLKHLVNCCWN